MAGDLLQTHMINKKQKWRDICYKQKNQKETEMADTCFKEKDQKETEMAGHLFQRTS